jgi:hypothetical protein
MELVVVFFFPYYSRDFCSVCQIKVDRIFSLVSIKGVWLDLLHQHHTRGMTWIETCTSGLSRSWPKVAVKPTQGSVGKVQLWSDSEVSSVLDATCQHSHQMGLCALASPPSASSIHHGPGLVFLYSVGGHLLSDTIANKKVLWIRDLQHVSTEHPSKMSDHSFRFFPG